MPKTVAQKFLRAELVSTPEPAFLIARERAVEEGCVDFASNIDQSAGPMANYPSCELLNLRTKLADRLVPESGIGPDNLLVIRGSSEGIDLSLRACLRPGLEKAVIAGPTFPMYKYWSRISGIEMVELTLGGLELDQLPVDALVSSGAKLAFVCQPNSPTGIPFPIGVLREFLPRFSGLVVVDEAYADFCPQFSVAREIKNFPNLVVLKSFSKSWGLAGARVGCMIAETSLIRAFRTLQGPFGTSSMAEQVLLERIANPAHSTQYIREIGSERSRVMGELEKMPGVEKVYPSQTNFILFRHGLGARAHERLAQAKIFLNDCASVAPGALRFSLRSAEENDRVLKALASFETKE